MKLILAFFCLLLPAAEAEYSEKERVQDRLRLVEELLRARTSPDWSAERIAKRKTSLDRLREYWQEGRFPKNTTHANRHPAFVDFEGTPCAVGYLMQRAGFRDAVKRIRASQNDAFLEEIQNADVGKFAAASGLELEELKLIQPTYKRWPPSEEKPAPKVLRATNAAFVLNAHQANIVKIEERFLKGIPLKTRIRDLSGSQIHRSARAD